MTALAKYAKLEAEARYFDGLSAQPRDVVICFGERSLVIMGFNDVVIAHWPLASLRAVGLRRDSAVQLMPQQGSDERLTLSDRRMLSAIGEVCPDLHHRPVDRKGVRRAFLWAGAAVGSLALIVFVLVPMLAGQLALMIPPEREQQLGDAVVEQLQTLLSLGGGGRPAICDTPSGVAALDRMAARLNADPRLPYPLRVGVLDHGMLNAIALPGGRILIFRGLLEAAGNPEEVAGVLAHEIGHVVSRDPTRTALRAAGTAGILGLLLGDVFGASIVVVATDAVLNASYQRDAEIRADETAYALLAEAGLPSQPFADFFDKLRRKYGETPGFLKLIASHPGLEGRAERAAAADRIGEGAYEPVLSDQDWVALRGICQGGLPTVRRGGRKQKP
ncbi:MAG: M48 family metallopeptidase [Proteobacteria bacterium]|nr:M48 family metallopeptidase [Pseudomonadota bacterium]